MATIPPTRSQSDPGLEIANYSPGESMAAEEAYESTDDENRKRRLSLFLPFKATETLNWGKREDISVKKMIDEILSHLRECE